METLENEIKHQGEKMKTEIDKITKQLLVKCREMHQNNSELLLQYKQEVQSL